MGRLRVWRVLTDDRAVSSTVSVVLLIAIAVILASVISVFAFDALDRNTEEAPQVIFEYEYDESADALTITHRTGDTLEGFTINFRTKDGTDLGDWSSEDEVEATESATLGPSSEATPSSVTAAPIDPSDTVLVVWEQPRENEDTAILGRWEGPDA